METLVPAEWDEAMVRFHLEENHCNENHIDRLVGARVEGQCSICAISNVKVKEFGLPE